MVGDLVELQAGDQIVADGKLVSASGLRVDESVLTGESRPVERKPGEEVRSGSFAVEGVGALVVTAVGPESYAERITGEARAFRHPRSPLEREMNRLLLVLVGVIVPLGGLLGYALWSQDTSTADAVTESAAAVVTLVPEGLILLASLTYAVAATRMSRRGVLVQQLNAVESLASVDIVCLDKTGTLTEPKPFVLEAVPAEGGDAAHLESLLGRYAACAASRNATLEAIAEAFPGRAEKPQRGGAILVAAEMERAPARRGGSRSRCAGAFLPRRARGTGGAGGVGRPSRRRLRTCSGATRRSWAGRCAAGRHRAARPRHDRREAPPRRARDRRVLPGAGSRAEGHVGRPPRDGRRDRSGGGDRGRRRRLDGRDLDSTQALAASVIGRITPEGKRSVVEALRARGRYVAMVGDGVNDVPALKASRLAIAQGSGTQMARSVADLVLVGGDFAAVPPMVEEGRKLLRNLARVAKLFVTKSAFATFLILSIGLITPPTRCSRATSPSPRR